MGLTVPLPSPHLALTHRLSAIETATLVLKRSRNPEGHGPQGTDQETSSTPLEQYEGSGAFSCERCDGSPVATKRRQEVDRDWFDFSQSAEELPPYQSGLHPTIRAQGKLLRAQAEGNGTPHHKIDHRPTRSSSSCSPSYARQWKEARVVILGWVRLALSSCFTGVGSRSCLTVEAQPVPAQAEAPE